MNTLEIGSGERLVYGLENRDWRIRFYLNTYGEKSTIVHYTVTRLESGDNPSPWGSTLDIQNPHWQQRRSNPQHRLYIGESPKPMTIGHAREIWEWLCLMGFTPMTPETLIHTQNAF